MVRHIGGGGNPVLLSSLFGETAFWTCAGHLDLSREVVVDYEKKGILDLVVR